MEEFLDDVQHHCELREDQDAVLLLEVVPDECLQMLEFTRIQYQRIWYDKLIQAFSELRAESVQFEVAHHRHVLDDAFDGALPMTPLLTNYLRHTLELTIIVKGSQKQRMISSLPELHQNRTFGVDVLLASLIFSFLE